MTPEEVTYLAVLLCSIPIGFVFKGRGPRARQWGGAAVGAALALLTCGPHVLHSLLTVLGTWGLLHLLPRRCGGAALAWTFAYLLFFRTPGLWGLPEPPPYANALQLMLTLKMVSLASDVQELREAGPKALTSEADEELIGSLQSCPGLGEILCYSYCYIGLLTGPFYRPGTHRHWVQGPCPRVPAGAVLRRLRWTPLLGALGEAAGRLFPARALAEGSFGARAPPLRLLHVAAVFFAFRMRFYVGWLCAEAACLAAALGAFPPASCPRPGCGPTRPTPRAARSVPPPHWDFESIRTVDPGGTERGCSVRQGLRRWNMTVQWWLQHYVHRRAPTANPALRSAWTMLASAYWHGLGAGLYLSFLSVPLWLAAERAAARALGGRWGALPARALRWLLAMRVFEYLSVGFVLREAAPTLRCWAALGFGLHLLPLLLLLLPAAAGGGQGGRPPGTVSPRGEEGGGGPGDPPTAGDAPVRKRRETPDPLHPHGEEGGDPPTAGDTQVRKRRETPNPLHPHVEEEGDPPTAGDPQVRKRRDPPAPLQPFGEEGGDPPMAGDPQVRKMRDPPTPLHPYGEEGGGSPSAVRKRRDPPTQLHPHIEEGGGTPSPGDPQVRKRRDPPTPLHPTVEEEEGAPTPLHPNNRGEMGGTPSPGDPPTPVWDPPSAGDPQVRKRRDPPAPLHPDNGGEGGGTPSPGDPPTPVGTPHPY